MVKSDTIVARTTPPGIGGIAIIRISGEKAFPIAKKIFSPLPEAGFESHKLYYGQITNPEDATNIDEVMITRMSKPHSYTGEDVVEINCHGSPFIVEKIIQLILKMGARIAEPGEFTKRAFLNGRMDLAQAEAVCDLICAQTSIAEKIALNQLEGHFSKEINQIKNGFLDLIAQLEAELDFPDEEDVDKTAKNKILDELATLKNKIEILIYNGQKGKVYQEGIRIAIIGKPNVGKSSIFNALLKYERAIVTSHPGTTRDTIEGTIDIAGIPIILVDTAGIRNKSDEIEKLGIERTRKMIESSDINMFILDNNSGIDDEDLEIIKIIKNKKTIPIINKCDLESHIDETIILKNFPHIDIIKTSAITNEGFDQLEGKIKETVFEGSSPEIESVLVTNARHLDCLQNALQNTEKAIANIKKGISSEFYLVELKEAVNSIKEIVGESVSDDILERIFSKFCIGK